MVASTPVAVRVRAHAKLNLDLRILGRRPDGFHELRTVFQSLALHDTLTFIPRQGAFRIACDTPDVPRDRTNLVWQAADRLWKLCGKSGRVRDVAVNLEKRVPAEAGLGGGSADAAATLRALSRLWGLRVPAAELASLAAELGSDVPFFLRGGTALGVGRGDAISSLPDVERYWVVLLLPAFTVSSSDAYRWYDAADVRVRPTPTRGDRWLPRPWQSANDLEPAVTRRHPEIGRMKAALSRSGAWAAAMSGSGSAVFGLFEDRAGAASAADRLAGGGWRIVVTDVLDRHAYTRRTRPAGVRANAPN
jgi:4-diphosphocytidyl-2-C-methyl-D-erythritol kinase